MRIGRKRVLSVGTAIGLALVMATAGGAAMASDDGQTPDGHGDDHHDRAAAQHVLLLSVDGMHQSDLDWYVHAHPRLRVGPPGGQWHLVQQGADPGAVRFLPRDGRPGHRRQPVQHRCLLRRHLERRAAPRPAPPRRPAPTTAPGAEVTYFEQLERTRTHWTPGKAWPACPDSILGMTGTPAMLIDPAQLPVDPTSCQPVYPHSYLQVNTIFEVARAAGLRTAWADKHPAYEILNGPSGHRNPGPVHPGDQQ